MRGAGVLAVLAAVAILAGGAGAAEDPGQAAIEAMAAGRYREAVRLLERQLAQAPDDGRALYNLACSHSRLGAPEEAARRLRQAWKAGLRDLEQIRTDPDLEALRASAPGREAVADLEKEEEARLRRQGRPLQFEAPVLGACRLTEPEKVKAGRRYPLVLALHGSGGGPEPLAGVFQAVGLRPGFFVCAPYGPYAVRVPDGVGYSWYPPPAVFRDVLSSGPGEGDRAERRRALEEREQAVSERFVLAALEAVQREHPVDPERVFLLGHSQGGGLAYALALRHPDRFHGLAVVGARLPERAATAEALKAAAGRLRVLVCHSPEDQAVPFARAEAAHRALKAAGVETRLHRYAGGHGLTGPLVREIAAWVEGRALPRPPLPGLPPDPDDEE